MSIDLFIKAIKPAGDHHDKMMEVYFACQYADIKMPKEAIDYFGDNPPNALGVVLNHSELPEECKEEFFRGHETGYRIDLSKLPPGVQYLEVYVRYCGEFYK
jgi:hypothetical protein